MAHEENGRSMLDTPLEEGEPCFILRGNDKLAWMTVGDWIQHAIEEGVSPEVIQRAGRIADAMMEWKMTHGAKKPD